ncbi:MAG: 30S ribosomal protein S8 [Candidatus Omnitrophota bacterium]
MAITDPISDMLAILKNGIRAHKETIQIKRSNLNESILKILKDEGFILNHKTIDDKRQGLIKVYLRYDKDGSSYIKDLKRISKPGLRVYSKAEDIKSVYGGLGVAIFSTPEGVITDKVAKEKNIGGEVLCEIW